MKAAGFEKQVKFGFPHTKLEVPVRHTSASEANKHRVEHNCRTPEGSTTRMLSDLSTEPFSPDGTGTALDQQNIAHPL